MAFAFLILVIVAFAIYGYQAAFPSRHKIPGVEEYTGRISKLGRLLELLKNQESESSMIALQGPGPGDFFAFRFLEEEFVIEYQIVEPIQVANEPKFVAAVTQAGLTADYWGDGSDGWDKYVYARIGAEASEATELAYRVMDGFSGLKPETSVDIRVQDFTLKSDLVLARQSLGS